MATVKITDSVKKDIVRNIYEMLANRKDKYGEQYAQAVCDALSHPDEITALALAPGGLPTLENAAALPEGLVHYTSEAHVSVVCHVSEGTYKWDGRVRLQTAYPRLMRERGHEVDLEWGSIHMRGGWDINTIQIAFAEAAAHTLSDKMRALYDTTIQVHQGYQAVVDEMNALADGIGTILKTYPTINAALKAWPPLKDLLTPDIKDRLAKQVARRSAENVEVQGVDLDALTRTVAVKKLTGEL